MRTRSSLPAASASLAAPGRPPAAGFLAAFVAFVGRSSSRVVRCGINGVYEASILPQNAASRSRLALCISVLNALQLLLRLYGCAGIRAACDVDVSIYLFDVIM